ncbi:hypothetical protein [Bacillus timonensis]|nr:hypothetical protein [Bacillus timonensis]
MPFRLELAIHPEDDQKTFIPMIFQASTNLLITSIPSLDGLACPA